MKATEWLPKFEAATTPEDMQAVLEEYGTETAELLARRTAGSKPETRLGAGDGAVREQRQKFLAILSKMTTATKPTIDQFEEAVTKACADYRAWQATEKKRQEAKAKAEAKKNAENGKGRTFGQHGKGQQQKGKNGGRPFNKGKGGNRDFRPRHPGGQGGPRPQGQKKYDHPQKIGEVPTT